MSAEGSGVFTYVFQSTDTTTTVPGTYVGTIKAVSGAFTGKAEIKFDLEH